LQNADASKTMTDCHQLQKDFDRVFETYTILLEDYYTLHKLSEKLNQKNLDLKRAISRAVDYLACMDRISEDKPNEQLAMDVLNEALGENR
jgi:heterodisulfide reductase subunit B